MHEDVHEELVDGQGQSAFRLQGHQDEVSAHQGHQDEGGTHGLHVGIGLGPVGHSELCDQNTHYVQQEEEVHLDGDNIAKTSDSSLHFISDLAIQVEPITFEVFSHGMRIRKAAM